MKILLTGTSSFIGSNLLDAFMKLENCMIAGTYRSSPPKVSEQDNLKLYKVDLNDYAEIGKLPKDIDVVIHVAGTSQSKSVPQIMTDNILGTQNLINYALFNSVKKFIYLSSNSVYGEIKEPILNEDTPSINPCPYGLSKLAGEYLLRAVEDQLPSVTIRLPGVVGPGAHRNWLATCLEKVKANKEFTIFNPNSLFNNVVHVENLSQFLAKIAKKNWNDFKAFTIGASNSIKICDVIELLSYLTNSESQVTIRDNSKKSFLISSDRAIEFGYQPSTVEEICTKFVQEN